VQHAGISGEDAVKVFVAIDKLDKVGLPGVKKELVSRGITESQIDRTFDVLDIKGDPIDMLQRRQEDFKEIPEIHQGASELTEIVGFLSEFGIEKSRYTVDLCLARGLGYYTGPVHETVVEEPAIGSLSGGGRYDKLIGRFLGRDVPACGMALGIERIIDVMGEMNLFPDHIHNLTDVLVTVFDTSTRAQSLRYVQELRRAGLHAELYIDNSKFKKQMAFADRKSIPFVAILGPGEIEEDRVTIKNMKSGDQVTMAQQQSISWLQKNTESEL
jgi:histidyl-tRNA synthetase